MPKLTRYGICYDLTVSPYSETIVYDKQRVKFMFSSQLNRDKFVDRMNVNRQQINRSLSNRFKFDIQYNILCDITLYNNIENRGFYIVVDGKGIEWLEEVTLDGLELTRAD